MCVCVYVCVCVWQGRLKIKEEGHWPTSPASLDSLWRNNSYPPWQKWLDVKWSPWQPKGSAIQLCMVPGWLVASCQGRLPSNLWQLCSERVSEVLWCTAISDLPVCYSWEVARKFRCKGLHFPLAFIFQHCVCLHCPLRWDSLEYGLWLFWPVGTYQFWLWRRIIFHSAPRHFCFQCDHMTTLVY
jgi:hypothetical protein